DPPTSALYALSLHDALPIYDGEVEIPFLEDRAGDGFPFRLQHHEHPLLAFRQHHLVGGHVRLALGHTVEVEPDAKAALVAHLDRSEEHTSELQSRENLVCRL